jgi:aminocarboxymuconate-semialdehyde decarboxylase
MKLDVFNHILPAGYFERLAEIVPDRRMRERWPRLPALWDVEARLRQMDQFGDYAQILSLANPALEMLPMNNPDAAVAEAERAITELDARGVQVFTNVLGRPLSAPEFFPVFETLAHHDLPVWIHPIRGPNHPDYASESRSEHEIWFTFGWPYETSAALTRLIFAGLFDRLPDLKIITHHMGGMVPFFAAKIAIGFEQIFADDPAKNPLATEAGLKKQPLDYFRLLNGDTALNGSLPALQCGHAFFGSDRSLFASDAPFDPEGGSYLIRSTIEAIEALDIGTAERAAIYAGNTRRLLKMG